MALARRAFPLTLGLVALALLFALPGASALTVPGFTVVGSVSLEHEALTVEGTITVPQGATLTLSSVDLTLAPSATGGAGLIVEEGGRLVVTNSAIAARSLEPADAVRVEIRGSADIEATTFRGLGVGSAPSVGVRLAEGFRVSPGGLLLTSRDIRLAKVTVRESVGCGVTVLGASPTMTDLDVGSIAYRFEGNEGFAAGVCVIGGSPTIDGLTLSNIGASAPRAPTALYSAGVAADGPIRFTLHNIVADGFAPALLAAPAAHTVAVLIEDPSFVEVSGGRISNLDFGLVLDGWGSPVPAGSIVVEHMALAQIHSLPYSQTSAFTSDPGLIIHDWHVSGCGGNGIYVESQNSGVSTIVTLSVDNSTVYNCLGVGINLYDNSALGAHYFNVWDSNASLNRQEGIFLHGVNMLGGLNIQMSNNGAWSNDLTGIRTDATYSTGGGNKFGSYKLEYNTADNNSNVNNGLDAGGIVAKLGQPATMSIRYINNTARGNGAGANLFPRYFGHLIEVHATSSIALGTFFMTGVVSRNNTEYGFGIIAGGGGIAWNAAKMRQSAITGQPTGVLGIQTRLEIWDSTMGNGVEFEGDTSSFFLMGTPHTRLTGTTTGSPGVGMIVSYKLICMHAVWQNNAPLNLVPLVFTAAANNTNALVWSDVSVYPPTPHPLRQTDSNGDWTGYVTDWTYDPNAPAAQQISDWAPLTIGAQLYQTVAKAGPFDLTTNICGPITFTDPFPPEIIVSFPVENKTYTKVNLTVSGIVNDDLSGVAGIEISLDGIYWTRLNGPYGGSFSYTFTGLNESTYDLQVRAWDKASEGIDPRPESLLVIYSVTIDITPPGLSLTEPPLVDGDTYYTSNSQLFMQGRFEDLTNQQNEQQLYVNGQPLLFNGTSFTYLADLPSEGPQSFLFLAIDAAGNTRNLTVTIFKDTVIPTLIVLTPAGKGEIFVNSHDLTVTGITDANAVVKVNNIVADRVNDTFSLQVTLDEGQNTIFVTAVDAAGNQNARSLLVNSDTIAPTVDVSAPAPGAFLNSTRVVIQGTVSEPVQFLEIKLRIFPLTGASFEAVLGIGEGSTFITVNATDRAGNIGRNTIQVTIDTHPPALTLNSLPEFLVQSNRQLAITGSVSENATITVNGAPLDVVDNIFDSTYGLVEGANLITIKVTDRASNVLTVVRHVTLDTQEPSITIGSPAAGSTVHTRTVQVKGTSEPNSTVQVGSQFVLTDASGAFSAWVTLEPDVPNPITITATDAAGNKASMTYTLSYAAAVPPATSDMPIALAVMAALAVGLGIGGRFLAKKRVDDAVEAALENQKATQASHQGMPGYTDAYAAGYPPAGYAPAAAPPEDPYAQAYAPAEYAAPYDVPAAQPTPPPQRAPRPPRPPSN